MFGALTVAFENLLECHLAVQLFIMGHEDRTQASLGMRAKDAVPGGCLLTRRLPSPRFPSAGGGGRIKGSVWSSDQERVASNVPEAGAGSLSVELRVVW